jgi:hypothetical protein
MFLSPSAKSLVTEIFNGQAPTAKVRDEEFTYAREHGSAFNKIFTWKWAIPLQDQNHEFREARILLQRAKYDWGTVKEICSVLTCYKRPMTISLII